MENQNVTLQSVVDILQKQNNDHEELMSFLGDHMVTRGEFKVEIDRLDGKINQTKLDLLDAMDEKLGDLKGDLVVLMRKEDRKLSMLVEVLREKELLSEQDVQRVLSMEPFPRLQV